ncbi:DUF3047 domain-containing protein [Oceanisphaera arctica]|uniref:DUF3047 domain-containing protein n=1 Tax=Oceanisphaera arctica TaxID=641510 RepID=A0A2P5TJY9_9GAMM|nr:DUF3047 domain-containing protein [Oceanisphaera arctica]PPL15368.1 hypothetical protein UN63_12705 [Oceanisphaera arctica]GHA28885.1 hypothetical protein GCM10007082_31220 [Oceanisphaera arctica]
MYTSLIFSLLLLVLSAMAWFAPVLSAQAQSLEFTPADMLGWEQKSFAGNTDYQLVLDPQLQQPVVRAQSRGAASGLFYEQRIDLDATPWLSWRWRVERFPAVTDERVKAGDDFAVRVYVVVRDGWTRLSSKAISYVWAQQAGVGQRWPNPFAGDKAMMLALRNQEDGGGWVTEKRNLKADLRRLFGKEFRYIDAVAIMTDADNGKGTAIGYYADLVFTRE